MHGNQRNTQPFLYYPIDTMVFYGVVKEREYDISGDSGFGRGLIPGSQVSGIYSGLFHRDAGAGKTLWCCSVRVVAMTSVRV